MICALLCIFAWCGGVSRFSCDVFLTLLRNLSAICVFFYISSEHYRLKRVLQEETEPFFAFIEDLVIEDVTSDLVIEDVTEPRNPLSLTLDPVLTLGPPNYSKKSGKI